MQIIVGVISIVLVVAAISMVVHNPFGMTSRIEIQADAMVSVAKINALSNIAGRFVDDLPSLIVLIFVGLLFLRYTDWTFDQQRRDLELQAQQWRLLEKHEETVIAPIRNAVVYKEGE